MRSPQNRTLDDLEGEIIKEFSNPDSSHSDMLIDTYVNKGYSSIADQSDLIFRPASTLGKYSIFDYKIKIQDVLKGISTDEIILEKFDDAKINKGQRQIKEYDYNEIKKAIDFVIHGEYKLPYNNFLYERGLSIRDLKSKKTIMYIHEKIDFTLTLNMQKNFPRLSKLFIADAIRIFDRPQIRDLNEDKEFVKDALSFFSKYGTHYLNRTKYGSRFVWISELNLTKWDNQAAKDTPQETTSFKSGSIAFESSRDFKSDRLSDFEISAELGNCEINMLENRMEKCNGTLSSVGLLGFEVEYLFRVFDSEKIKAPILQPDNTPLPADRIKNIYTNMKMLLDSLTSAIDIRNLYIKDLISYNNFRADYGEGLPCVKYFKIKRFHEIPNSLLYYDNRDNRFMPIFKFNALNKINYNKLNLISKSRSKTYICNLKDRLFDQAIIDSPYLFNKRYLNNIGLFDIEDFKVNSPNYNKTLEYNLNDCQNIWVNPKSNFETNTNVKVKLICLKYANNFLDNKIITDIKVKNFVNNECKNFNAYGRDYECLCDNEFKTLTGERSYGSGNAGSIGKNRVADDNGVGDADLPPPEEISSDTNSNNGDNNGANSVNAADINNNSVKPEANQDGNNGNAPTDNTINNNNVNSNIKWNNPKKNIHKFLCFARKIFKE